MKKLLAIVLSLVMLLSFAGCGAQKPDSELIKDNGKIVVGITDYAPMDYKEKGSDEWTGFDAEFARLFAKELGVEAEFIEIDWDNKFMELESKSIDCVWNGMTITDEAKLNASVSNAYVKNAQVLVMKADKVADIKKAEDAKDLKFAVEKGSAGADCAKEAGYKNIVEVGTQGDALMEVKAGTADATIIDITMANAMTGEGTSYVELAKGIEYSSEEYGVAFRKESDLTEKLNEFMASIKDGELKKLAEKYQLTLA
ncbi:MAG: transporter substrate-binding domain-containing protein [Ruminococcaceae bacterium]|nr:transporter substrate-binding domain-containing protein [Oscillospiraceae bacterium]